MVALARFAQNPKLAEEPAAIGVLELAGLAVTLPVLAEKFAPQELVIVEVPSFTTACHWAVAADSWFGMETVAQ